MQSVFALTFARTLRDALSAAGWQVEPNAWRWSYPPLGLSCRILTERKVAVRREGVHGETCLGSGQDDPVRAALHVARQLHSLRKAAQAERDIRNEGADRG